MEVYKTVVSAGTLLLFLTAQIMAQEQPVLGQGNVSCTAWLENQMEDAQVAARTAWVLGYITAFNQYGSKPEGDVSGGIDTKNITAWVNNYCSQHRHNTVYKAAAALVDEFRQRLGR